MLKRFGRVFLSDIYLSFSGQDAFASAEGKIFSVPARLLVELPSYKIIAFGQEAREVEHAGMGKSAVVTPFRESEVQDERGAEVFLRNLFRVVLGSGFLLKPRVWLALPARTTPFMREVWMSVLFSAGARDVIIVHPFLAIAASAGLPLQSAHGYAVGSIADEGVSVGLVAFGHIQREVWRQFLPHQKESEQLEQLRLAWEQLLANIPAEFLGPLQQEGLLLSVPDDSVEWAKRYTKSLDVPVTVVDRVASVSGLRLIAKEAHG